MRLKNWREDGIVKKSRQLTCDCASSGRRHSDYCDAALFEGVRWCAISSPHNQYVLSTRPAINPQQGTGEIRRQL